MLTVSVEERKRVIGKRIIMEVAKYYATHKSGMEMRTLSAKYAKASNLCGGFPELMAELEERGDIGIKIYEGGAREVYPKGHLPKPEAQIVSKSHTWF